MPPRIWLHPALLGGATTEMPWGINPACLGLRYALDVLLHECIHVAVAHLHGGQSGPTSHNDPAWIAEVNRIAPLLGFGLTAGRSTTRRVPTDGPPGPRGKPPTKVARVSEGDIAFEWVARFPYGYRHHLGTTSYYYGRSLPFPPALADQRNIQLDVTDAQS
jgi:hypothetical protein